MKKIKQFKDIVRFMLANKPVIQEPNSASFINDDLSLDLIVEEDIRYSKVINNLFYYKVADGNNINLMSKNSIKRRKGTWGLITAFPLTIDTFYIFYQENDQTPKFLILDKELEIVKESVKGCNYGINSYLFRCYGNKITCFDVQSDEVLWERELESIVNQNYFFLELQNVYATIESGQLLALDIQTGNLKWRQAQVGKTAIYGDKIYSIASYSDNLSVLKTINAHTGEVCQSIEIKDLKSNYGFWFTGKIKVCEEYIFATSAGRPGLIAVFDRESLELTEVIKLEESIPNDENHLHWHKDKLYVLDFGKTLHIYEK